MSDDALLMAGLLAAAVVAILLIVVALPVVLNMRHAARDRELQHTERLKALEMGRSLPGDPSPHGTCGSTGSGIGVWVPIAALGIALGATRGSNLTDAANVAAWASAGCVGVTALICGTILTLRAPAREPEPNAAYFPAKPDSETEFDTVSRRGV